jgi:hypothetical protein
MSVVKNKPETTFFSLISLFIILSLIISSCNTTNNVVSSGFIQKRKYNKGYFVSVFPKRQKVSSFQTSKSEIIIASSKQPVTKTEKIDENLIASTDDLKQTENIPAKPVPPDENIIHQKQNNSIVGKIIGKMERKLISSFPKDTIDDKPKVNGFALAGFLSSIYMPVFSVIIINQVSTTPIVLIILFLVICSIILNIIGLIKIKKNPAKWKGKGLATIGLILGILYIVIPILIFFIWAMSWR